VVVSAIRSLQAAVEVTLSRTKDARLWLDDSGNWRSGGVRLMGHREAPRPEVNSSVPHSHGGKTPAYVIHVQLDS